LRATAALDPLYAEAARATARHSKSFYFATRFFPADMARAARSVYWFCRYTDDLVDEAPSLEQGRADWAEWARLVEAMLQERPVRHPVLTLFGETVRRYEIPAGYPLELIEGMRMDLEHTRYKNFAQLRLFCYRVASVVGLMMMHVIGFREPAGRHAIDLGIAMQLTNILRDVGEDLARGRVYLPAEEMERFGYREEDLRRRVRNDPFRALMRFQIERARDYYARAEPGLALLDPRGRFAVKMAARVYREILRRIEALDYDIFGRRAVVPTRTKYRILLWNT
jgi:phytoene synthase